MLLRASDFCRRRTEPIHSVRFEIRQDNHSGAAVEEAAATTHGENDGNTTNERTRQVGVAWASMELMRQAQVISGCGIVWLSLLDAGSLLYKVAVRLFLLEELDTGNSSSSSSSSSVLPTIYLSPLAAANLGLYQQHFHDKEEPMVHNGQLWVHREAIVNAERVTLRCWRRPLVSSHRQVTDPLSPLFSEQENDSTVKQAESAPAATLGLPEAGTALQRGKMTAVVRIRDTKHKDVYIYEVLSVYPSSSGSIALGTNDTLYQVEEKPLSRPCPQLPSLEDSRLQQLQQGPSSVTHSYHPDLDKLISTMRAASTLRYNYTYSPESCVLHVIGSNDHHHIDVAIELAAHHLGRYCLRRSNWASLAHLAGHTVTTGGWSDKLTGLQAVLQDAKRQAPCVLHLAEMDREWSGLDSAGSGDGDDSAEQSRIWSLLVQELTPGSSNHGWQQGGHQNDSNSTTGLILVPPVLVVITTNSTLPKGALAENLLYDSLEASLPDDKYISMLWKTQTVRGLLVEDGDNTNFRCLLRGRTAKEIQDIQLSFAQQSQSANNIDPEQLLQDLTWQQDQKRRNASGMLARIPNVKWEDVGGLAHVRREILDRIELPLKHPHLFPPRSGILLFGPPGSGKTMVAKAVATECNLPFLSIKGPELLGSYVGESESNVRSVFQQARQLARQNHPPASILFFDELDSLAPRRGDQASGANVMDRVVATLIAELDRDDRAATVFCLGATNRPDLLDPSLLRPGRLDRLVYLGAATGEDCTRILAAQFSKLRLEAGSAPTHWARLVAERLASSSNQSSSRILTGADLSTISSRALERATKRLCDQADQELEDKRRETGNDMITLDDVLESWTNDRLEPVVTLDDLIEAALLVSPSVTQEDLRRYENLRDQFQVP